MTERDHLALYEVLAAHADAPLPELLRMAVEHGASYLDATVCILAVQSNRGNLPRIMAAYCEQMADRLTLQDAVDVMLILTRGSPEFSEQFLPKNGRTPGAQES